MQHELMCGHCGTIFRGTDSQARKVAYEKQTVYCSQICRRAALNNKAKERATARALLAGKPPPGALIGPCKHCGKMFESKTAKLYCSMRCYTQSEQFRLMREENSKLTDEKKAKISETLRKGEIASCLECGAEFYQKPESASRKAKKFCGSPCYRSYLAKRFDRWIANPEGLALPQCYDEFLDREELACIITGCSWHGKHLTLHVNQAHGVTSDEFKRAAGFNLSTGVIAKSLAQAYSARNLVGVATQSDVEKLAALQLALAHPAINTRWSLEAREHRAKERALRTPRGERK
jgi:hypothetical protein